MPKHRFQERPGPGLSWALQLLPLVLLVPGLLAALSGRATPAVATLHVVDPIPHAATAADQIATPATASAPASALMQSPGSAAAMESGAGVLAHPALPGHAVLAAEDVPTVVFSRSRAPGIAQNFDDAVANGAPTRLNRVGSAARDANRRAALRGQDPAPAGQSLDEYPFACSAQGGCGATVGAVPAGEQSYQGGVLSQFFQGNGIGVGDPCNVMFGP